MQVFYFILLVRRALDSFFSLFQLFFSLGLV